MAGSLKIDFKQKDRPALQDDLLLLSATEGLQTIVELPLGVLTPYPDQPFRPYPPAKLEELAEDIKANGLISPIIVRPHGNGYQILAGHNRCNASRKAGLSTIPAIVRDVDDDTAALVLVNTNLNQRDELLPSEKAFAYKLQLEALSRQGQRTDLTSTQVAQKLSASKVGECVGISKDGVRRYIRLTHLLPGLLDLVDSEELKLIPAVALSYLNPAQQELVLDISAECDRKISVFQAEQLKKEHRLGALSHDRIWDILLPQPAQHWNPRKAFAERGKELVPKTATEAQIEEVVGIIERYFNVKSTQDTES